MAAQYTKVFADPYPNGWKAKPDLSTPYTTSIRNNHDATLRSIEQYLYDNPIGDISSAKISELSDVDMTYGYYDGQVHYDENRVLRIKSVYNSTTQQYEMKFVPVQMKELNDLDDVTIVAGDKVDGNVLTYDYATDKIKLKTPSGGGGGGISYSTTEHKIGTDENGNDLYAKTIIDSYPDEVWDASAGTMQYQMLNNVNHVIKYVECQIEFYPGTNESNNQIWIVPYYDINYITGTNKRYAYINVTATNKPTINVELCNYDTTVSGQPVYKYIKCVRLTAYYTKTT